MSGILREADIDIRQLRYESEFVESDCEAVFQTPTGEKRIPVLIRPKNNLCVIRHTDGLLYHPETFPGFVRVERLPEFEPPPPPVAKTWEEARSLNEKQSLENLTRMQNTRPNGGLNPEVENLRAANLKHREDIRRTRLARGERA